MAEVENNGIEIKIAEYQIDCNSDTDALLLESNDLDTNGILSTINGKYCHSENYGILYHPIISQP